MGLFAEIVIAAALDTEETSGTGGTPSTVTVPVTIAADPTPGDTITINVDGVNYLHTVPVGDETTQQVHDAIAAILAGNAQGFVVSAHSGTTSSTYQLAWPGSDKNGKTVTLSETGSTFTVAGPYTFAGGADADAAASDNWEDFVANSNAGTVWAFWDDVSASGKKLALVAGDTKNPANINRKFFYGWKDSAGNAKTTTPIPVKGLKYDTVAYNAGQVQISKVKYGGTVSVTQTIHVRIIDKTPSIVPYPTWTYSALVTTDIDTAVAALATAINAETEDDFFTASASTDTLTVTSTDKSRVFQLTAYVEVSATQATDASTITFPTGSTQAAIAPIGDAAAIAELEKYYVINSGGINYAPEGTNVDEWQTLNSNRGSISQWGTLLVSSARVEAGIVRNTDHQAYVIVVVPTGSETALAAL